MTEKSAAPLPDAPEWRGIASQSFPDLEAWEAGIDALRDSRPECGPLLFVDAFGREVEDENDVLRARAQGAFPIRWFRRDQLAQATQMGLRDLAAARRRIGQLERWCGLAGTEGDRRGYVERVLEIQAGCCERQAESVRSTGDGGVP
jgi:hypothetical protein